MKRLLHVVAFLLALPALGAAQTPERFVPIRGMIKRWLDSTGAASVAVAVAKDGKVLWEEGFGWANREKMIPATQHTMYSQASISKPITATGLMVLADRGLVDIDKPANEYLGAGKLTGLAGDATHATVKRVLSHTAGLPLHYQFFYDGAGYGAPTMDEAISRYGNLVFPPGTVYEYSNLGFGIIDYIISRVSGRTYSDFMRTEVFLPLGLTHTTIDIGPGLEEFAAERYDNNGRPIPFYTFDHVGASAVYSSAHDLVRFGMFHLKNSLPEQKAILKPATIDLMHTPVPPASYGLGFSINNDDMGLRRVSHGGGMPGVATTMALYPTENIAVVVLANSNSRPDFIAQEIVATLVPRFADSLKARRARPRPTPAAFAVIPELVGSWKGTLRTWQRTVPMRLLVKPDGDIHVWVADQPRAILNNAGFTNNRLSGRAAARMPTDDAGRWRHDLLLGLILGGGSLRGQVNAMSLTDVLYYSVSGYADLKKE